MGWHRRDDARWGALFEYHGPLGKLTVSTYGGQVLSWVSHGLERLFLSPHAQATAGKPIRGGIPIVFPQFADRGPGLRHGFARTAHWEVMQVGSSESEASIGLELAQNEELLAAWPHRFTLRHSISIHESGLKSQLEVVNEDHHAFCFSGALHSYWLVDDVTEISLHGLETAQFKNGATSYQHPDDQPTPDFRREVERHYVGCHAPVTLRSDSHITLKVQRWTDWVIWNPGPTLASSMPDLTPEDAQRFVCIEPAILTPIEVLPGKAVTFVHEAMLTSPRAASKGVAM